MPSHRLSVVVWLGVFLALLAFQTLSPDSAGAYTYSNDFEGSTPWPEWNYPNAKATTPVGGRNFLGIFSNHTATLILTSFGAGASVTVEFDLFILRSWDGNNTYWGPDYWSLFAGSQTLMNTTFSNDFGGGQSYPGDYYTNNSPRTGAVENNTLGYGSGGWGDSVYHITKSYTHAGGPVVINFQGYNLQGWNDEGWGLDNVRVNVIPLPGTILLLGSGLLGLVGLSRKR